MNTHLSLLGTIVFCIVNSSIQAESPTLNGAGQSRPGTSAPLGPNQATGNGATQSSPEILSGDYRARFQRLDGDRNGKLTPEEFTNFWRMGRRVGSGTVGTAGSSSLTASESKALPTEDAPALFQKLDSDHDGLLTVDEFLQVISAVNHEEKQQSITLADQANLSRNTGATGGVPSLKGTDHSALFHRLDLDRDGALSRAEFGKINSTELPGIEPDVFFGKIDANGDGKLAKDEFLKMPSNALTPSNTAPVNGSNEPLRAEGK